MTQLPSAARKQKQPLPTSQEFRPYLFALKAGTQIQNDFLDYSLILLQVGQSEILRSPQNQNSSAGLFSYKFSR